MNQPSQPVLSTSTQTIQNPELQVTIQQIPTTTPSPTTFADEHVFEQNRKLGRGVNLGNALEAPQEGEWGLSLREEYFERIAEAGFNSVRVPIRWSSHASADSPYTIDPVFFERIDWVIDQALKNDLTVVINIHHYEEINEEPRPHKERFLSIWQQIAERYQDQPETVYFELLNEPTGTLGATVWNEYAAQAIEVIRKTNPDRTIIIGPGNWNAMDALYGLILPDDDRNLIVTVHYYSPFQFTHQGAEWVDDSDPWLGTTWDGTLEEKQLIERNFDAAVKWADQNRRPLFLGEFGAYSKADMESRVRWTEFIARTAEQKGMSWAYWEFGSGFGVFDPENEEWRESLLQALIPG